MAEIPKLPDTMSHSSLVPSREIAQALSCSIKTVQRMARVQEIPSIRVGAEYRFDRQAVLEALRNGPKTP